ncbi:MAG TPA: hypothetical protein VIY29_06395, partial [Ktedonobacteraceae bacterium]
STPSTPRCSTTCWQPRCKPSWPRIPGLGEIIAIDVKHIYAWVKENHPRESMRDRFCKDQQPTGDPDCRLARQTLHQSRAA